MSKLDEFMTTSYSGAPFFATVEPGLIINMMINLTSIEVSTAKTPWGDQSEATAAIKEIIDEEGDEAAEDGDHSVPFWACSGLQKVIKEHGKQKGWLQVAYKRETSRGKNRDGEKVDINEAFWSLPIED